MATIYLTREDEAGCGCGSGGCCGVTDDLVPVGPYDVTERPVWPRLARRPPGRSWLAF